MNRRKNRLPMPPPAPVRWMRRLLLGVVMLGIFAGLLFALGLGGWHLYRYELAPRLGWVSARAAFQEQIRVATSPFRTLPEKEAALDDLLAEPEYFVPLTEGRRAQLINDFAELVAHTDYPRELRYKAARVQALARGAEITAATARQPTSAVTTPIDPAAKLARLQTLSKPETDIDRQLRAERTQLLLELFRAEPCRAELAEILEQLHRQRAHLDVIEKSFLYGIRNDRQQQCF